MIQLDWLAIIMVGAIAAAAWFGVAMHAARRRAERSEARLREFMENSPACVSIKDGAGRYEYMNAAAQQLLGRTDWKGRTDEELAPLAPRRVRQFQTTKFPLRDAQGGRGVGTISLDITEQVQNAEELRVITDTVPVAVVRCSSDFRYVWANPVFAGWLGRRADELAGRKIVDILGARAFEVVRAQLERLAAGQRVDHERLADYPGLGRRWVHVRGEPTFEDTGRPSGWVTLISDVHERKLAEEALARAREHMQLVADSMPAAVALMSRDLRYVWVNRRCAEWLGKPAVEIEGRSLLEVVGEKNAAAIRPFVERVLAGEQVDYERLVDYSGMGGERWVRNIFTPTKASGGAAGEWMLIVSDVHDRRSMEEALRDADRRKDEFLATLAHELRNPLAPIRNAVAILRKKRPDDPELGWSGEVIDRQVEQMSRLVDDLLDIARIASGKLLLRKERIPIERAIDMAIETSRPNINAAGHRLSVLLPSERVTVEADETRLAQVFANLLNNAARYTPEGGEISLVAEKREAEVVVAVQDNGIGFPPDAAARVFEPFAQLTSSNERAHGGLGIGLSLVHGIVLLHGGRVEATSAGPGRGSEFTVRLPLPAFTPLAPPARSSTAHREEASAAGLRVLVADDNRDAADSLHRLLALYGYDVKVAYDGRSAMQIGAAFHPQAAVLDIDMPGASGLEVAQALRGGSPHTALIAVTGWGQEGDRRRAMEAGFDYHLTKPVDPGSLNDLLLEVAGR